MGRDVRQGPLLIVLGTLPRTLVLDFRLWPLYAAAPCKLSRAGICFVGCCVPFCVLTLFRLPSQAPTTKPTSSSFLTAVMSRLLNRLSYTAEFFLIADLMRTVQCLSPPDPGNVPFPFGVWWL